MLGKRLAGTGCLCNDLQLAIHNSSASSEHRTNLFSRSTYLEAVLHINEQAWNGVSCTSMLATVHLAAKACT